MLDRLVPTEEYPVCIHWIGLAYLLVCLGELEFIIYVYSFHRVTCRLLLVILMSVIYN